MRDHPLSLPLNTSRIFLAHLSAEWPSNISPMPSKAVSKPQPILGYFPFVRPPSGSRGAPEIIFRMESSYFCDLGAHAKIRTPTITPSRLFPLLSAHPRLICGGKGGPRFFLEWKPPSIVQHDTAWADLHNHIDPWDTLAGRKGQNLNIHLKWETPFKNGPHYRRDKIILWKPEHERAWESMKQHETA